ncbi:PAS domain-containing protein, partial [Streptomyces sp. S6]
MVTEGGARQGGRAPRAEVALKTVGSDPHSPERVRRTLEQALVFAGASCAAGYAPGEGGLLCLVDSAGVPRTLYGLRETYPPDGNSPVAVAVRTGRPVRLGPAELADCPESRRMSAGEAHLTALPAAGGCLVAVGEHPFDAEDHACLGLVADALSWPAPRTAPPEEVGGDGFALAMDTGRVEVGDRVLELFGLTRDRFDGRVETLLGLAVPEDLPTLMSFVEADHMSLGDRELEFRVIGPSGTPRWLRLRGRLAKAEAGRQVRLLGTIADAAALRPEATDVARVQRLASVLSTAGTVRDVSHAVVSALRGPLRADRIALAELEGERLVVTVLDPPYPESWPELWRLEWRGEWPDAPMRSLPTLASVLREGRVRIWTAGTALEP